MSGIDRLRTLAGAWDEWGLGGALADVADQIERELREDAAWVRDHGGLEVVKEEWKLRSNLKRMCEKEKAKVERQQRHIEFVQGKCRERQEHIVDLNRMVAEMRPRLMPEGMEWPRFEDGEPVRIWDAAQFGSDDVMEVVGVELNHFGYVLHGSINDGMRECVDGDEYGVAVNRPAPKVLDADGVEVEVGDDLYSVEGMLKFHVSAIDKKSGRIATEAMFALDKWADPKMYTHRAPVLAADGKPLREGETVWSIDSGTRYTVEKNTDELIPIKCRSEMGTTVSLHPSQLTHERPVADAWERLEEDATIAPAAYCHDRGLPCACDPDPDAATYFEAMARDLVRRAKALAGGA